ncbi:MAG: bifunctional metallophosphatase/5'-nucleotidase [Actinomycetota bacterium]|nr:bifunctional metallophosphatase/5'-nucleotidase [Actinomycetota bacterium]
MFIGAAATRPRWKMLWLLVVLALVFSAVIAGTADAKPADDGVDYWLTVLHNNDGESDLMADEVFEGDEFIGYEKGVAYFAKVLKNARTEANMKTKGESAKRGTIFVSSGDNFLASPTFTASLADGIFYDALALDALRYDAIALGNHDFDFGPDVLAAFISEGYARPGHPPYVSANLDFTGEPLLQDLVDDDVIVASMVVEKKGEHIGIVGATTPALPTISSPRDVIVNEVAPAVQVQVDELEAMGVEIIVMISHLQDIDGDIALAAELSGVDVMVAGGGDELLANPDDLLLPSDLPDDIFGPYPMNAVDADGYNVPVVTTSGQYGYVGQLTVGFDDDGEVVMVDDDRSGPIRVVSSHFGDGVEPVGSFVSRIVAPVEAFVADLAANVIGTSEVDLDGTRGGVRSTETNQGNLMADSLLWQATQLAGDFGVPAPDVALQNGGGIRNDSIIPGGDITELDTFDMAPFPNFVTIIPDISREQFKEILENAVSRIDPPAAPGGSGRFAQIAGFSFTFVTSGTPMLIGGDGTVLVPGTRITEVALDDGTVIVTGGVVVTGSDLTVATIDFLARGGDQYPYRGAPFTTIGVSYQQALSNYIQNGIGGLISAADYPEGGEGRTTELP